jgi:hypothetical protein
VEATNLADLYNAPPLDWISIDRAHTNAETAVGDLRVAWSVTHRSYL